jgi:hypothetical protein
VFKSEFVLVNWFTSRKRTQRQRDNIISVLRSLRKEVKVSGVLSFFPELSENVERLEYKSNSRPLGCPFIYDVTSAVLGTWIL